MIRKFQESDWDMIQSWWGKNNFKPIRELLPDTTYIISNDKQDIACASLLLTNSKYACLIENLVGNPDIDKELRKNKIKELFKFLEIEAKSLGYKAVSLFSPINKLKLRYVELGFMPIQDNITTFSKLI